MIAENQVHRYPDETPQHIKEKVIRKFIEAFYPSDEAWRARVLASADNLIMKIGREFDLLKPEFI